MEYFTLFYLPYRCKQSNNKRGQHNARKTPLQNFFKKV
nr:MAG TPA: hypothetical protein [Siphoviridae sp. ctHdl3]